MNILTNTGYKNIEDVNIGEDLIYFDLASGQRLTNKLIDKKLLNIEDLSLTEPFEIYEVNGMQLHGYDSIWTLENNTWLVSHVQNIGTGSTICDDNDQDLVVSSYKLIGTSSTFWQLSVDGDSSYIGNGITLHNASRYWVGGGSTDNWTATGNTNWAATSGGANNQSVPVAVDNVFFDANSSSSCSITTTLTSITNLTMTGHTGTITISSGGTLTISGTPVFSGTSTITGSGLIVMSGAVTITTNSQTIGCNLTLSGASNTKTLLGSLTVNGITRLDSLSTANTNTLNRTNVGDRINANGGLIVVNGANIGTAEIYLQGGTVSCNNILGTIRNNTTINGNITISGTFSFNTGTLTYLSGNVITTGSLFTNNNTGSTTINTSGITWSNVTLSGNNITITLPTDLSANFVQLGASGSNFQLNINSGATQTYIKTNSLLVDDLIVGSAAVQFVGTGTWSNALTTVGAPGILRLSTSFEPGCNLRLDPITGGGTIRFDSKTLTYNGGTVTTTGATFGITTTSTTTTLNLRAGFGFDNLNLANNVTITNQSETKISGTLSIGSALGTITLNGSNFDVRNINFISGNNSIVTGTTKIYIRQTGNINWIPPTTTGRIRNDIIFASEGQTIISGTMRHETGTVSYEKGLFTGSASIIKNSGTMVNNFFPIPTTIRGSWN